VQRATLKNNAPNSCSVARGPKAWQHCTTSGIYFSTLPSAPVNVCFVISRNKCNKFMSSSMTQQHRISTDLPNAAVEPKKNQRKCTVSCGLHHVPREHGSRYAMFPGTWRCTDKTGQHYFCTSPDARWTNHDRVIQIVMTMCNVSVMCPAIPAYYLHYPEPYAVD